MTTVINYDKSKVAELAASDVVSALKAAIDDGVPWPKALLDAVRKWPLAEEKFKGVHYKYLLLGEAFDWLVLAARLLDDMNDVVSEDEKVSFLFDGHFIDQFTREDFYNLIGPEKRVSLLNYRYGVTVEQALILSIEDAIRKERRSLSLPDSDDLSDKAFQYIYGDTQRGLLRIFRKKMGRTDRNSITVTELKEFTYWLFSRRVQSSESARIASDTKKGLARLSLMLDRA
ncbi:MAG: hypothetical protein DK304_000118 [Chloroflexi bacterium]|jgi:hypothetical protein|nr:MAG: hypothetical protein DK304_000118 [Chloroflexota bacterium]